MIHVHYWPTPNGHKITIFLEEVGFPYVVVPVNIGRGEQFAPAFLAISPNNRMPAIVDDEPEGGGDAVSVFESGAILVYLAEKARQFLPTELRERKTVLEWLAWQVGGVGPMFGQWNHFRNYAQEQIPYAVGRYSDEVNRLYGVLEHRLEGREYVAGAYSIADMAIYPWMGSPERYGQTPADFPRVMEWIARMRARPAVERALKLGADLKQSGMDEESRKVLFGQRARAATKA